MSPTVLFILSLGVLVLAGHELAAAGKRLGIPDSVVALLESIALR